MFHTSHRVTALSIMMILIAVAMALSITACKPPGNTGPTGTSATLHHQTGSKAAVNPQATALIDPAKISSDGGDQLFSTPEDQHKTLINAIQNATASIDIVNYHLSDPDVVAALKTAAANKIKIRVLLDQNVLSLNPTAMSIFNDLNQSGIEARKSSSAFSITHQKSMLVDYGVANKQTAYITSMNLITVSAQTRDYGIQTQDSGIINEMKAVFDTDFGNNSLKTQRNTPGVTQERLLWSSPANAKDKILALIRTAKKTIDLEVENFGDPEVVAGLVAQAKAGVKIRTMSPGCVAGAPKDNPLPNLAILTQLAQVNVVNKVGAPDVDATHPYIHAKMILVDSEMFYLGSENFSTNSLTKARELGILTDDQRLAAQLQALYNTDISMGVDPTTVTADSCAKATGPYSNNTETSIPQNDKQAPVPTNPNPVHATPPPVTRPVPGKGTTK